MIAKIVQRKSKNNESTTEGIFNESEEIIFLESFVQLKLGQIFSRLYRDG